MWRRLVQSLASVAGRRRLLRVACVLLGFCVINALWSIVGGWSINFGGESYRYIDRGSRESGIYSCDGYLVIALRNSLYMRNSLYIGSGLRPRDLETRRPVRQTRPWSISAYMAIGQRRFGFGRYNGILDDRPHVIFPGALVNWQSTSQSEWYNRGLAIHWGLLSAVAAVVPALALIRHLRRAPEGHCAVCGYDLRATPDRCPECGTAADLRQPAAT